MILLKTYVKYFHCICLLCINVCYFMQFFKLFHIYRNDCKQFFYRSLSVICCIYKTLEVNKESRWLIASLKENAQNVKFILNQMKCPALFTKSGQGNFLSLRIQQRRISHALISLCPNASQHEVLMERVNYQIKSQHKCA